jgi:hypothetical protein
MPPHGNTNTTAEIVSNEHSAQTSTLCEEISPEEVARIKERWLYNRTNVVLSHDAKSA